MDIKVKYIRNIKPIVVENNGDWIDLRAGETCRLSQGDTMTIPLGVAMELPEGYEAIIAPRSSTFKKWGIMSVNSIGIIDNSYKGDNDEWGFPVIAFRETIIYKNDRICQFRIQKNMEEVTLKEVANLNNKDRGGFGSTGSR